MWLSALSSKGQVTLPAEIQRILGVTPRGKIACVIDAGQVWITAVESTVARTAGALKSQQPPETAEQLREAAERAIAADVVERLEE
jgi:bifunctional DNA-binding transcriptional regulator/antitoxin component of YhaV-PrlF toxin-antitoxin module